MVEEKIIGHEKFYMCVQCNFAYKEKELAEKCEAFCKEHHSCNLEITKHAVKIEPSHVHDAKK